MLTNDVVSFDDIRLLLLGPRKTMMMVVVVINRMWL